MPGLPALSTTFTSRFTALLLAGLALVGCAPFLQAPSQRRIHDARTFKAVKLDTTAAPKSGLYTGLYDGLQGVASYAIEVPDHWNGTLIMYAHGDGRTGQELRVSLPPLRDAWIAQGYAWAESSYSANFYDVRAALEDTNALALAFNDLTGKGQPQKYLIVGSSLGGHVAAAAVDSENLHTERNKVRYAASMPVCGVLHPEYQFQWLADYTLAAAQLAGYGAKTYPNLNFQQHLPGIKAALFSRSDGPLWQENSGAGTQLFELSKQLTGGERPVFDLGFRAAASQNAVLNTGHLDGTLEGILARNSYGNQGVTYRWTAGNRPTPAETAFNAALIRLASDPNANPPRQDGLRWLPRVNGEITAPVLTLHTTGDFYVPFRHEQDYARAAQAAGKSELLVQRAIRAAGHCEFTPAELREGFNDLVQWENTGQKPTGDDVLTVSVVAGPNYGCQFTRGTRAGVAACPAQP